MKCTVEDIKEFLLDGTEHHYAKMKKAEEESDQAMYHQSYGARKCCQFILLLIQVAEDTDE